MSTQKHIIEVTPPKYEQVRETMEFRNYNYCEGTGKVMAEVTIKWRADYGE